MLQTDPGFFISSELVIPYFHVSVGLHVIVLGGAFLLFSRQWSVARPFTHHLVYCMLPTVAGETIIAGRCVVVVFWGGTHTLSFHILLGHFEKIYLPL